MGFRSERGDTLFQGNAGRQISKLGIHNLRGSFDEQLGLPDSLLPELLEGAGKPLSALHLKGQLFAPGELLEPGHELLAVG